MGTLGKAVGSFGAYIAGSEALVQWLLNRARAYVFTTSLPAGVVAASRAGLQIVCAEPERRERLRALSSRMRRGLEGLGFEVAGNAQVPILAVLIGGAGDTMRLSAELLERGVLASGIRPPTVPAGTSRVRVTLMATMTDDQVDRALEAFAGAAQACGLHAPGS